MLSPAIPEDGAPSLFVGRLDGRTIHAVGLPDGARCPPLLEPVGLRALHGLVSAEELGCASRAAQLVAFDAAHRFCGRCGSRTTQSPMEHSRICPCCRETVYPRISPAVIVLVTRGYECLLARSPRFPPGMYSAVAGFVEPGETLEHAVHRELAEECGVRVKDLKYAGSQPWPFPHSLMLGFFGTDAGGTLRVDGVEVESAGWYHRDSLPDLPPPGSIARRLIEMFVKGER